MFSTDTYTCPQGETLKTTGSWHKKTGRTENSGYQFKKYRSPACKECPVKHLCTSRTGGREIDRSQYADAVEENNKRYQENPQLYRKRQEINEHIFGTIKRQWGYNHTNLKGLEKVNGEHSLIMLVYNIKRAINILGVPDLIDKIKKWNAKYPTNCFGFIKTTYLKLYTAIIKTERQFASKKTGGIRKYIAEFTEVFLNRNLERIAFFHNLTFCGYKKWRTSERIIFC